MKAVFEAVPAGLFTLTVDRQGNGKVISELPEGIDCPPDCTSKYERGTKVGLRATPDPGYRFDHWEGACTGGVKTCTVTMDGDKNVIALERARSARARSTSTRRRVSSSPG